VFSTLKAQTVQWIGKSATSYPALTNAYAIDDSNNIVHCFNAFASNGMTLLNQSLGSYVNNRNAGIAKISPDGVLIWQIIFSAEKNNASQINMRSIVTDGSNFYIAMAGNDEYVVRKNNVITDTIPLNSKQGSYSFIKITNDGQIEWVRALYSLNTISVNLAKFLSFNKSNQSLVGGFSVFDSAIFDVNDTDRLVLKPNKQYRVQKCGSIASTNYLFSMNTNGEIKKLRALSNDKIVAQELKSFQSNLDILFACDTTVIDNIFIKADYRQYFKLDTNLRFNLVAEMPLGAYNSAISYNKGDAISFAGSSYISYSVNPLNDTLYVGNRIYKLKEYELISFDQSDSFIARRQLLPSSFTDSVSLSLSYNSIYSEFIYVTFIGNNTSTFDKIFTLDGISYTLKSKSQFSMVLKMDKLLNILWLQINSFKNVIVPSFSFLGNDLEGNLIMNGTSSGKQAFPILNDSLPAQSVAYNFVLKIRDQSIIRGEVSKGPYCAGDTFVVPYTAKGVYESNNQFIAQLSNEDGSFDDTTKIFELGRITSTQSDTILGSLPKFQVKSSPNYRIRIISTAPIVQSFYKLDTLKLLIYSTDKANPGPGLVICKGDSVELNTFGGTKWNWSPGNLVLDSTARTTKTSPSISTQFKIVIADSSGCGDADTAFKWIIVRDNPQANVTNSDTAICINSSIDLFAKFALGDTAGYQWKWHQIINGQWIALDSGQQQTSDTLQYTLPIDSKDSVVIALALTDQCSPQIDTAFYTLKVNKDKPFAALNLKDTAVCPGAVFNAKAKFFNAVSEAYYKGAWYEISGSDTLLKDTFNATDSSNYEVNLDLDFSNFKDLLLVLNNTCSNLSDSAFLRIDRRDDLEALIQFGDSLICVGERAQAMASATGGDSNAYQFEWRVGNVVLSDSMTVSFQADTSFLLQLIVKDNCMPLADTVYQSIVVNAPLELNNALLRDSTLCLGNEISWNATASGGDTSNYNFTWYLNNTPVSNTKQYQFQSALEFDQNDTLEKTFEIKLKLSDNCTVNSDSSIAVITVLPALRAQLRISDSLCFGQGQTLLASGMGGNGNYEFNWYDEAYQLLGQNDNYVLENKNVNQLGLQKFILVLKDNCTQYKDTIDFEVLFLSPLKLTLQSKDTCSNFNVFINSSIQGGNGSQVKVDWFINRQFTEQNNGNFNFTIDSLTIVSAVANDACSEPSDTVQIRISTLPKAWVFVDPSEACAPANITYTIRNQNRQAFQYQFDVNNNTIGPNPDTDSLINTVFAQAGTYTARWYLENNFGCKDTLISKELRVNPLPKSDFDWTPDPVTLDEPLINLMNNSKNAVSYKWFLPDGDTSLQTSPTYSITDTGTFRIGLIAITDKNCRDTLYKTLIVNSNYRLYIPDAFSPNGDNINDVWTPFASGIENMEFTIFNRWGELVFKGDAKTPWDGFYQSQAAQQGVYLFQIRVKPKDKGVLFFEGMFHLLR
jgi:gliding motility-associated-like protein